MATIVTISNSVGANRIIPTIAIPYPTGNPEKGEKEFELRHSLVKKALDALVTNVDKPTIF
ncbi:glycine reductase [Peptostreptococcus canis]|nr:glycine reductase [Peptostreptococcus canis]